ncbi:MAG: phosphatidylserine decarboxylase, partial [Nitrososphaera sp.]|nr:phosphatidylserine decarboxylase [Nitrososphaera sp.]
FKSLKHLTSLLVNERVFTQINSEDIKVGIVQIASRLVRRIECYLDENDCVNRGQRIGLIKFGSQVDLLIAHKDSLVINVKVGDQVKAGLSIIGSF